MQEKQIKVNSAKNQIHRHIEQKQEKLFCLFELEKLQGYILDETIHIPKSNLNNCL